MQCVYIAHFKELLLVRSSFHFSRGYRRKNKTVGANLHFFSTYECRFLVFPQKNVGCNIIQTECSNAPTLTKPLTFYPGNRYLGSSMLMTAEL